MITIVYNLLLKQIQSRRTAQYTRLKQPLLTHFEVRSRHKGMSDCRQQGRGVMSLPTMQWGFRRDGLLPSPFACKKNNSRKCSLTFKVPEPQTNNITGYNLNQNNA